MEPVSSTNPGDAPNAMTPDGWTPTEDDDEPTVGVSLPEQLPIMEVTGDTTNVDEVTIVVTDNDEPVFETPVEVNFILF